MDRRSTVISLPHSHNTGLLHCGHRRTPVQKLRFMRNLGKVLRSALIEGKSWIYKLYTFLWNYRVTYSTFIHPVLRQPQLSSTARWELNCQTQWHHHPHLECKWSWKQMTKKRNENWRCMQMRSDTSTHATLHPEILYLCDSQEDTTYNHHLITARRNENAKRNEHKMPHSFKRSNSNRALWSSTVTVTQKCTSQQYIRTYRPTLSMNETTEITLRRPPTALTLWGDTRHQHVSGRDDVRQHRWDDPAFRRSTRPKRRE